MKDCCFDEDGGVKPIAMGDHDEDGGEVAFLVGV